MNSWVLKCSCACCSSSGGRIELLIIEFVFFFLVFIIIFIVIIIIRVLRFTYTRWFLAILTNSFRFLFLIIVIFIVFIVEVIIFELILCSFWHAFFLIAACCSSSCSHGEGNTDVLIEWFETRSCDEFVECEWLLINVNVVDNQERNDWRNVMEEIVWFAFIEFCRNRMWRRFPKNNVDEHVKEGVKLVSFFQFREILIEYVDGFRFLTVV